jgi:hypothetical protein
VRSELSGSWGAGNPQQSRLWQRPIVAGWRRSVAGWRRSRLNASFGSVWLVLVVAAAALCATAPPGAAMPRGYELVTPNVKEEGAVPLWEFTHASEAGNALFYVVLGAFPGAESSQTTAHYLARRSETAWKSQSLDPSLPVRDAPVSWYYAFTDDLDLALFSVQDPRSRCARSRVRMTWGR